MDRGESPRISTPKAEATRSDIDARSIVGPYRIVRLIARGGMGRVFLARDVRLGRLVALKFAREALATDAAAREQFLLEARATASLSHPNVVTIFDVGEHDGLPWAAYEFIEGKTLASRLQQGPLPLDEALRIARGIAEAVATAHAAGILHRDLKPANVIIGRDGRARVLDFGIVRFMSGNENTPRDTAASGGLEFLGTPSYMAPEQWSGHDVAATDVWALGLLLCESITGANPLREFDRSQLPAIVISAEPIAEPLALRAAPAEIAALVMRCLAKDPAQRPTAADVVKALTAVDERTPTPLADAAEPYPGVRAFDETRASTFFGREREAEGLDQMLDERALALLVGAPGCGKTSLVEAGVLPLLRARGRTLVVSLRPGRTPMASLARALVVANAQMPPSDLDPTVVDRRRPVETSRAIDLSDPTEVEPMIREHPELLAVALEQLAERDDATRVVLWIDALEDLVTVVHDAAERQAFLDALTRAAVGTEERARAILAVRDDALGRLPFRAGAALAALFRLDPPGRDALRQAFVEPAMRAGNTFDDEALADAVVTDALAHEEPYAALQCAASELWARRDVRRRVLSSDMYAQIGRVDGAIARHAEGVVEAFTEAQTTIARSLLVALAGSRGSRVAVSEEDLVAPHGGEGRAVLSALVDARLIVRRAGEQATVELAFSRLPRIWPRLERWLESTDSDARAMKDLTRVAEQWAARGERVDELWRGRALDDAAGLVRRRGGELPEVVRRFVAAGEALEIRAQRTRRVVRGLLTGSVVLVAIASFFAAWALRARERDAQLARRRAEHDRVELLVHSARIRHEAHDPFAARAMLRSAFEQGDSMAGRSLLAASRTDPARWSIPIAGVAYAVRFDASGRRAFVALQSGEIWQVDAESGEHRVLRGHSDQVLSLAESAGRLFSGAWGGELWVWDVATGEGHALRRFGAGVLRVVPLSNGRVAAALLDGRAVVVDATGTSADTTFAHEDRYPAGVAVERGTDVIAIGGRSTRIRWFDTRDGHVVGEVATPADVTSMHALAGEHRIVAGLADGRVVIAHPGAIEATHSVASGEIRDVAIAEDRFVITGSSRGELSVLDLTDGAVRSSTIPPNIVGLDVHGSTAMLTSSYRVQAVRWDVVAVPPATAPAALVSLAYSPDGSIVYAGGIDVIAHDAQSGRVLHEIPVDGTFPVRDLAVSPDGRRLAGSYPPIGAFVGDARSGSHSMILGRPRVLVRTLDVDFDRDVLAIGDSENRVVVARPGSGATLGIHDGPAGVSGVRIAPAESVVHIGYADGTLVRWDYVRDEAHEVFRATGTLSSLTRSRTGRWLAMAGPAGIDVIDAISDERVHHYDSPGSRLYRGAFSPDEQLLAVAGADGRIHLWNLADGRYRPIDAHEREANGVAFDPTGRSIASVSDDGTMRVFDVATGAPRWWFAGDTSDRDEPGSVRYAIRDGAVRCVWRRDGTIVRETAGATRERVVPAARWIAAGAGLCAAADDAHVFLLGANDLPALDITHARIHGTPDALWIADDSRIRAYDANGRIVRDVPSVPRIGAFATMRDGYAIAVDDMVEWRDMQGIVRERFNGIAGSPPVLVAQGPFASIVVGYGDGRVCAWARGEATAFVCRSLRGRIVDARADGGVVRVASELDDHAVLDLSLLGESRCEILRAIWREEPFAWVDGGARRVAASGGCGTSPL